MKKISFFMVFAFVILISNGARGSRCTDISKQLIASLELDKVKHEKQIEFIKNYLIPSVGARMGNPEQGRFRSCKVGKNCFEIEGEGLEKNLKVKWSSQVTEPDLEITDSERILILPMDYPLNKLRDNEGQGMINRWTLSTSLYPFSRAPEKITQELGLEGASTHVPRDIQDNAIAVGNELLKIGRSFLYVAPTGTGKSYVLASLLRNQIKLAEKKLHIVTVHQNELVGQMAKEFFPENESGEIILLWPGAEDRKLRPNLTNIKRALKTGKPVVVATSIQSITGRKSSTGVYDGMIDELTDSLATIVMDETHHVGATTWGAKIEFLRTASDAKFIGASATPIHKDAHVQKVFDERAYWAYADKSVEDVVKKAAEGQSLFRPIKEVIDQAIAAIDSGELAPVENFYSINAEGLKTSWDVARRMAPLIDRHRSGFIAVENRKVAEGYLAAFEKVFGDRKKFVVFHAGLEKQERAEIYNRMRNGEDLFLVVVNLLDEGVDFPHMSLYIDLNRKMNARNLLQRMGRVERPFSGASDYTGKEYCEVATLTDWTDNATIAEHLALLTAFQKNAAKFRGRRARIEMVDPEGMIAINEEEMNHEFKALLDNVRNIMKEKNAPGPWERAYAAWVKNGEGIFVPPKQRIGLDDGQSLSYPTFFKARTDMEYFERALSGFPEKFKLAVKASFEKIPGPWEKAYDVWILGGKGEFVPPKKGDSVDGSTLSVPTYMRAKKEPEYFTRFLGFLPEDFREAVKASFEEKPSPLWQKAYDTWVAGGKGDFNIPKYGNSHEKSVLSHDTYDRLRNEPEYFEKCLRLFPEEFKDAIRASFENKPNHWQAAYEDWLAGGKGEVVPPKRGSQRDSIFSYDIFWRARKDKDYLNRSLTPFPEDFVAAVEASIKIADEGPWQKAYEAWIAEGSGIFTPPKSGDNGGDKYGSYMTFLNARNDEDFFERSMEQYPEKFINAVKASFEEKLDPWKKAYESWAAEGAGVFSPPKASRNNKDKIISYSVYLRAKNDEAYFESAMDGFPIEFKEAVKATFNRLGPWEKAYESWAANGGGIFIPPKFRKSGENSLLSYSTYWNSKNDEEIFERAMDGLPVEFKNAVKASFEK